VVFLVATVTAPLHAESDPWRYCATPQQTALPVLEDAAAQGAMEFSADQVVVEGTRYRLQGAVTGGRGDQYLSADRLDYDAETDTAQASGEVRYQRGNRLVSGDSAELHLGQDRGRVAPARFWITDKHIRGDAEELRLEGPVSYLETARFTTCDEGSNDWWLKAASLRLDSAANEGVATHARVQFMHVPIFYFPYLSFPLEGRKSGFLVPSLGDSSVSGTEFSVPYYWNIAPHRDATIVPRLMSERGVLWETEFRYLNRRSHGQLELAHLPGDRVFDDDRSALSLSHQGDPAPGWRTRLDYRYVSDADYLDDFGGELATSSVTHLERLATVDYRAASWQASLRLQGYQTLDQSLPVTSRPYQRLPQLRLTTADWQVPGGLALGLQAELVRFERDAGVVGNRYDLQPRISWPLRRDAGFLVPKLSLRHTQYQLEGSDPAVDDAPARTLPVFSLDSGLFFDRELQGKGRARLQTLEPRLFYLYVPHREQADLIVDEGGTSRVFDTSLPVFSFSQLFRDNRFNGADRVGDANQLSAALTTRFLDERGRELFSASLGRIYYFRNREVTLPGASVAVDQTSDWAAEMKSQWSEDFSSRASLQWDSNDDELARGSLDLRYYRDERHVLRLGYRFEREVIKQADAALIWPLATRWNLVGRWLRSMRDHVTLESLKGLEYQSCCWAVRVVQRSYRIDAADEEVNDSFWIQLELKGLTSVGRKVENLLTRDILAP
jgi:LPS-assembly protein